MSQAFLDIIGYVFGTDLYRTQMVAKIIVYCIFIDEVDSITPSAWSGLVPSSRVDL